MMSKTKYAHMHFRPEIVFIGHKKPPGPWLALQVKFIVTELFKLILPLDWLIFSSPYAPVIFHHTSTALLFFFT